MVAVPELEVEPTETMEVYDPDGNAGPSWCGPCGCSLAAVAQYMPA
jgi:hypothetical protein